MRYQVPIVVAILFPIVSSSSYYYYNCPVETLQTKQEKKIESVLFVCVQQKFLFPHFFLSIGRPRSRIIILEENRLLCTICFPKRDTGLNTIFATKKLSCSYVKKKYPTLNFLISFFVQYLANNAVAVCA